MIDQHILHLTHTVNPGNSLPGERWLDLRLAEDHDACRLDVEPGAAGLDLADQDCPVLNLGEFIDQILPFLRRRAPCDRADDHRPQKIAYFPDRLPEIGVDDHLFPSFHRLFTEFYKALRLGRSPKIILQERDSPHPHEVSAYCLYTVGCRVFRRHLAPLLFNCQRRQFIEHHVPLPAKIYRRQHLAESRKLPHSRISADTFHHVRAHETDQLAHLPDFILQGRSCHEQDPLRFILKGVNVLRPLGLRILDVMRLVNDQHGKCELIVDVPHYFAHALVVGHRSAAEFRKAQQRVLQQRPVQEIDRYVTEFLDFSAPVDHNRRRADHQKAAPFVLPVKVRHRGDGLDRFAKTHLVAKEHPLHCQNVSGAKFLIGAEIPLKSA